MFQESFTVGINPSKTFFYGYLLVLPRAMAAFSFLTVFSPGILQGKTIRNAFVMALVAILVPLVLDQTPKISLHPYEAIVLFAKEALIGIIIGIAFGFPLLSIQAFGFLIDNQRGATVDTLMNPASESETTTLGNTFDLFFSAFFLTSGIVFYYLHFFYNTYVMWPIHDFLPTLDADFLPLALDQLDLIFRLAVIIGGPVVLVMFLSEMSLAFMNKFAPQLNVFIMAMSIKSGVALFVLSFYFPFVTFMFEDHIIDVPRITSIIERMLT